MIDLHAHTSASDGSLSPAELISLALTLGLEALSITDHDTLAGFDRARGIAEELRVDLICGIELATKFEGRSVHLLGYFFSGDPAPAFREWIDSLQESRWQRNQSLTQKLRESGIDISMDELSQGHGPLVGRPHIAALLVEKGYVTTLQQAFDEFLDESALFYVPRVEPSFGEAIQHIRAAGGLASLPHPYRVTRDAAVLRRAVRSMSDMGLSAIEAYHSDHSPSDVELYLGLGDSFDLFITGGSDFHGTYKPGIAMGTGRNNNLCIPRSVVERLRASA